MIRVGSGVTGGGSATSDFFWQFVGGGTGPGNIETKNSNGVTGIDAQLSSDADLRLQLQDVGPQRYSGATGLKGAESYFSGVIKTIATGALRASIGFRSGTKRLAVAANDLAVTISCFISSIGYEENITELQSEKTLTNAGSPGSFIRSTFKLFQFEKEIVDVASSADFSETQSATSLNSQYSSATHVSNVERLADTFYSAVSSVASVSEFAQFENEIGLRVTDQGTGIGQTLTNINGGFEYADSVNSVVFRVERDGKILTNQTEAQPVGVPVVVARMPIYDATGAFIGYQKLYDL